MSISGVSKETPGFNYEGMPFILSNDATHLRETTIHQAQI